MGLGDDAKDLAFEVGCKVGSLIFTYLGIEERLRRRLTMCKRLYISKGGRIILIRTTLASLSIYFMSLFPIPRSVRVRIEQIQRIFLWGGSALQRRSHLVKWEVVCWDKKSGGLEIKRLCTPNKALLCK